MSSVNKVWQKMTNLSPTTYFATSLILKDAVGCVMYTSTARRNKKYTPDKRADVANYDLANGVINIALQLLAVKPIETLMTKVADSKFMKHFFKDLDSRLGNTDNKAVSTLLKHKSGLVKGSTALLSVIICQYIIKRFISPFFSMPASEKFQEWGLVKPKLYEGETYGKPSKLDIVYNAANDIEAVGSNIKDFGARNINDLHENIKDIHEDLHENIKDFHEDIHEDIKDFHESIKSRFEIQG